jgi:hypothetical protein
MFVFPIRFYEIHDIALVDFGGVEPAGNYGGVADTSCGSIPIGGGTTGAAGDEGP